MKINDRKKILCDWPPLQVPCIRWNWSQVMKPRLFRENVDTRIGHEFPTWKLTIERKSFMIDHPCRSPAFDGIGPRSRNLASFEKTLTQELDIYFQHENYGRKKILYNWPPLQVPCIRWNWSHVLKPRLFRENVDTIIGHKFPAWKSTIERKSFMIGHPYRSPLFDGICPNLACFEKTLTPEFDINLKHEK